VAGFEETSVRALAKVIQLLPPRLRRRIDALRAVTAPDVFGGGPALDPTVLTTIALACRGEERLRFDYTPRERETEARHAEPHHLVPLGRRWYLIAWDLDRADWRNFRVDRVATPSPTGARFRPRDIPGDDPAAWLRSRMKAIPNRYDVSVTLQISPDQVRALVGHWGTVEPLAPPAAAPPAAAVPRAAAAPPAAAPPAAAPPAAAPAAEGERGAEACRLRMNVDDLAWPVMILGVMGVPFTIESPPELRDHIRAAGETLLRGSA
jgi:predicted DNA-binding transcriptional regulator YafY